MKGKSANKSEVASNAQTTETAAKASVESGSLKSLLASGSSRKCTYSTSQDGYNSNGTVYVYNGSMRGDFTATVSGKETTSHMINKDSTSYIWTDGSNMAFKMSFDPNSATNQSTKQTGSVDLDKNYDFNCESWSGDSRMFDLPAGVTFSELPKVPAMNTETGASADTSIDSKAAQQLACNALSGTAKDQCLKALQ
jgi:hypothetical protein